MSILLINPLGILIDHEDWFQDEVHFAALIHVLASVNKIL